MRREEKAGTYHTQHMMITEPNSLLLTCRVNGRHATGPVIAIRASLPKQVVQPVRHVRVGRRRLQQVAIRTGYSRLDATEPMLVVQTRVARRPNQHASVRAIISFITLSS